MRVSCKSLFTAQFLIAIASSALADAPEGWIINSSDKDGTFYSVTGSFVTGGGMIQTQVARRHSSGTGNHTGTYFIDGNTIELRYDNGEVMRALFGYDRMRKSSLAA